MGWLRDHFPGMRESDVFGTLDHWSTAKQYYLKPEEVDCSRRMIRINYQYEIIGVLTPFAGFAIGPVRRAIFTSSFYMLFFGVLTFSTGWANNVYSRVECTKELLKLNDSPLAMAVYTIMNSKKYESMHDTFHKRYNFDEFKVRYDDFSITREMEPRIKGNWNPEVQDFTPAYKTVLKQKMSKPELEKYRTTHEWNDPHRIDEDEPLYVDLERATKELLTDIETVDDLSFQK
eukprot:504894_1